LQWEPRWTKPETLSMEYLFMSWAVSESWQQKAPVIWKNNKTHHLGHCKRAAPVCERLLPLLHQLATHSYVGLFLCSSSTLCIAVFWFLSWLVVLFWFLSWLVVQFHVATRIILQKATCFQLFVQTYLHLWRKAISASTLLPITSKPLLPLCWCLVVVGSNLFGLWDVNIKLYMIVYNKKLSWLTRTRRRLRAKCHKMIHLDLEHV
jgi:hypothetical protein